MTPETIDNLKRSILIHICKDGTLTYRTREQPVFNGAALPVFSVNTEKEAKTVILLASSRQKTSHPLLPNEGWFVMNNFSNTLGGMDAASAKLQLCYDHITKSPA